MSEHITEEETAILQTFVGKTLASFSQDENSGDFKSGDWQDDEPLILTFTDGSQLSIAPYGFHQSGSLFIYAPDPRDELDPAEETGEHQ